ncbi:exodeoxyribonuclease III [Candidatus Paracaedimonas acanthamoebae]|nr:exodeoxyribonuclease III [Candidatus Paracaedimonas acanthamoebae]
MKIVTWNVNSIKARLPIVINWLRENAPDIVLLQEIKCENSAFPSEFFEDLGYNIALHGQKTYHGVAILSKLPIEDVVRGLPDFEDTQSRYIEALVGSMRVSSIYVPNGQEVGSDKFHYKLSFYKKLKAHMKKSLEAKEIAIWGGDYNVAPFLADGPNEEAFKGERILTSQKEREAFRELLWLGITDAIRVQYSEESLQGQHLFSWWDYRANSWAQNKGFRIDHLLLSPQAADRLESAGINSEVRALEKASDHAPVWIKLR